MAAQQRTGTSEKRPEKNQRTRQRRRRGCYVSQRPVDTTTWPSGLVGVEKPHPEIFRQALQKMNAAPEESLYVGDMYSVDYLGATGAGMQAILMDVPGAYHERGVERVQSLEELRASLS